MKLANLARTFLRIGAVAFGGLGATVALIERELVEKRKVVPRETITEALTYTKLLPGSTVVQVVAYLGWRVGRWPGAAVATVAFLLPSVIVMLLLAYGYGHISMAAGVAPIRRGVLAAVVGLLLLTLQRLGQPILTTPLNIGLALGAFVLGAALGVNAVWIVLAAGFLGVATGRR